MSGDEKIPLTKVLPKLREMVRPGTPMPNYRQLYFAALDGSVSAEQRPNGRYEVSADLQPIIEYFGLAERVS
jgi:hypothetical protein